MLWYIHANEYLLIPTLTIAYLMMIKMYYIGSLFNGLTPSPPTNI